MKRVIVAGALMALLSVEARAQGRIFGMQAEQKGPGVIVPPYGQPEGQGGALIVEFDPLDGSTLNSFPPPVPAGFGPDGLAFDGTTLWFVTGGAMEGAGTLYALDPDDGSVLDTHTINGGSGGFDGLAALQGLIYVMDYPNNDIVVFSPALETVVDILDIDGSNPGYDIIGGLGAIDQPDALLATGGQPLEGGGSNELLEIDPSSGAIVDSFPLAARFTAGVATVGQTIYAADIDLPVVTLYDRAGGVIDIFNGTGPFSALGGDPQPAVGIPTASTLGLAILALLLVAGGLIVLYRRPRTS